jgi:hypothetical protein
MSNDVKVAITKAASPAKQDAVIADSVQSRAHEVNGAWFGVGAPGLNRLLFYRQKSPLDIPPYGYGGRGTALRRVWREVGADIVASAIAVMIQKVQATAYTIEGPQRTVNQAQQMIDLTELGKGWLQFVAKWVIDYCTQDNGAFTELIGPGKFLTRGGQRVLMPDGSPVVDVQQPLEGKPLSLAHIDSIACERTGVYDIPVRYYDINGSMHLMHNTRVHFVADMPQPDERLFGYGFCALSRCVSTVQYMVNLSAMRNESLDNMPPLSIMALENINLEKFEEQMQAYEADRASINEHVLRSLLTLVQQDSSKPVGVNLTPVRQLWESYDETKAFQWLVNTTSMAFGLDSQDLAPLASTAMGSGQQSTVLDEKAEGKGKGNILAQLEALMRDTLPASVKFQFDRRDDAQDLNTATIRETKARTVLWLYSGSTGKSGGAAAGGAPQGEQSTPAQSPFASTVSATPVTDLLPQAGATTLPEPTSLIDRDQAQRLLMYEIPEWADILDPDMTLREQVVVDDLDPEIATIQQKMYGPTVTYNSKSRRYVTAKPQRHIKAGRVVVDAITQSEIEASKKRLALMGINVDELRPA